MTSSPALEANLAPRPVASGWGVPLALFALAGFSGFLAERAFAQYLESQIGAPFSYLLGFALGALAAAALLLGGRFRQPLRAFGIAQLAAGSLSIAFSYCIDWLPAPFSLLLVLAAAGFLGASFPLIVHSSPRTRWIRVYAANLVGALAASLAAPFLIMPLLGPRGALWVCFALGAGICGVAAARSGTVTAAAPSLPSVGPEIRGLLAGSFGSGAIVFTLAAIWTHLSAAALGSSVYALAWMLAALSLGLFAGAWLAERTAIRWSTLFQCAALLLAAQLVLWDRVPVLLRFQNSFYLAELCRLAVAILLITPPAAVLGLIYPRLLASPHIEGAGKAYLAGYMSAAHGLGWLAGALSCLFGLLPLAGSEVALKGLVLLSAIVWVGFLVREPLPRKRLVAAAAVGAIVVIVLLGRWWNWGMLTGGPGKYPHAPLSKDVRFLPPSLVFKQEDVRGGFTTVVEQTVVSGETARTVRTLFANGVPRGDDNPDSEPTQSQSRAYALASQFVPDRDRALLIGLGTGRAAAALRQLGYRQISVAEFAPGIVQGARECFSGFNEGILGDPRVQLYVDEGRNVLLADRRAPYDLIAVELTDLYTREFYQLAHSRLRSGGVLQQPLELDRLGAGEIASQLATARSVFRYVGVWYFGGQGTLVASGHPLAPGEDAPLLDAGGVARLVAAGHPRIDTVHNRWLDYAAPRYRPSGHDWVTHNLEYLRGYR
jgi:spermidine synthase